MKTTRGKADSNRKKRIMLAVMVPSLLLILSIMLGNFFAAGARNQERGASQPENVELVGYHSPMLEQPIQPPLSERPCLALPPGQLTVVRSTLDTITVEYSLPGDSTDRPTNDVRCLERQYIMTRERWGFIKREAQLQQALDGRQDRIWAEPEGGQQ